MMTYIQARRWITAVATTLAMNSAVAMPPSKPDAKAPVFKDVKAQTRE